MKAADLREKSVEDLRELHKTLVGDVFQNRLKNFTNRLDDTSSIRKARKDLARVLTVLRQREKGESPKATAPKAEAKAATAAAPKAKKTPAKKSSTKKSEAK